tara:strand:- start:95 stop:472 length:378 start_codon:yes stop_codon:yes gene_type:complete
MLGDEEDYEINDYEDDNSVEEAENNNLDTSDKNEFITYEEVSEHILKKKKKTVPFLNKFEKARLIGVRIQQLSSGAEPKINTEGLNSINEIVEEELKQRKIPLIIKRNLPNGDSEEWKLEEFQKV